MNLDYNETISIGEVIFESSDSLIYLENSKDVNSYENPKIIKVLRTPHPSPQKIVQFNHEYDFTKDLDIPGVRKAYGLTKVNGLHALILEYFQGVSIREYFHAKSRESTPGNKSFLKKFLELAIKIAETLAGLHARNIIHRDISGGNILVHPVTGEIKLIDFGISSRIDLRINDMSHPDTLEGTLTYISPEQTGRMNRVVDYRTDLYSLGATFYELLAGQPPFVSEDPMSLVYAHIALQAKPLYELTPGIPALLSNIIAKLMEKNAEDRYQSAGGLREDLQLCLELLDTGVENQSYPLGIQDISIRLTLPEKLYGREKELESLLESFKRIGEGGTELALISGYAGVGKSALTRELYKPITEKRGNYIPGKFDQYQRNLPFFAFAQALNEFCLRLLCESGSELNAWKERILTALGGNAQVLIEIIPELEKVLGAQPPVPELSPRENKNRFLLMFQRFLRAICRPEHPLVIFIDDLQWADLASLELITALLEDRTNEYFLLICAYRDNEINESHPLYATLETLKARKDLVFELKPGNLSPENLGELIADSLRCEVEACVDLRDLVYAKTRGNPFFSRAFLSSLYEEELLTLSHDTRKWTWDPEKIKERDISDNVVELMTAKIQKLPRETKNALRLAACVGARFELSAPALIGEMNVTDTRRALWPAIEEGLILPLDQSYKIPAEYNQARFRFLHDRVQQAAYSLIQPRERCGLHLKIGRSLLEQISPGQSLTQNFELPDEIIFETANHLNAARCLIKSDDERIRLIELNLAAGQKARSQSAYDVALIYFENGWNLLSPRDQTDYYELCLDIYIGLSEAHYLNMNIEAASGLLTRALEWARSSLDKSRIYMQQIWQLSGIGEYVRAAEIAIRALNLFGMQIPDINDQAKIQEALGEQQNLYFQNIEKISIPDLYNLPVSEDVNHRMRVEIIARVIDSFSFAIPELRLLTTCAVFNLTLEHGLAEFTPICLAYFGAYLPIKERSVDYKRTLQILDLSEKLVQTKFPRPESATRVPVLRLCYIDLRKHVKVGAQLAHDSFLYALEMGEYKNAAYYTWWSTSMLLPLDLARLNRLAPAYLEFLKKTRNTSVLAFVRMGLGLRRCLGGENDEPTLLNYEDFNEEDYLRDYGHIELFCSMYRLEKLKILVFFERYGDCRELLRDPFPLERRTQNILVAHELHLMQGIMACCLYPRADALERSRLKEILNESLEMLERLTEENQANFLHALLILRALERAYVLDAPLRAIQLFEKAVTCARQNEFPQNEYLANKLLGQLYLEQDLESLAVLRLNEACHVCRRWGAGALLGDLQERYGDILKQAEYESGANARGRIPSALTTTGNDTAGTISGYSTGGSFLDMSTMLKASRILSRELNLERLLTQMMSLILENAGAERGFLILLEGDDARIEAALDKQEREEIQTLQSLPLEDSPDLSHSIVHYVIRTGKNVVFKDALQDSMKDALFSEDPYIHEKQTRSILCMPLRHKDKIQGALYLENNLSRGAFTEERCNLLDTLLAQAAISLENARVYDHLEELVKERTRELEKTHKQLLETAHRAGMAEVAAGVLHNVGNALNSALTPATLIGENLEQSRLPTLHKLVEHLERQEDLSYYISKDERGKKLPEFLKQLSKTLTGEQADIFEKLNYLTESLDQISEVIRLQQSYTGMQPLKEELSLAELVEDALQIDAAGFEERGIKITCEFSEVPPVKSDRHRLMLILINLLNNARDAILTSETEEKVIRLFIEPEEEGRVVIRVEDKGEGIKPENLDKIFRSRFSTRDNRQGFGLHNSANAAAELGGELSARSAGPGQGAVFTLTIPLTPAREAAG